MQFFDARLKINPLGSSRDFFWWIATISVLWNLSALFTNETKTESVHKCNISFSRLLFIVSYCSGHHPSHSSLYVSISMALNVYVIQGLQLLGFLKSSLQNMTVCTKDQPVAVFLPIHIHTTTQTQKRCRHLFISYIHSSSLILRAV